MICIPPKRKRGKRHHPWQERRQTRRPSPPPAAVNGLLAKAGHSFCVKAQGIAMDDYDPFSTARPVPTATRPLLGLTVLVIEDSRFACEAMRLLCLRSGARIRRADCLRSARRHLRTYFPSVIIIDIGLPDGSGRDLISELSGADPRVGVILATSGDPETESAALAAGADGFLPKPITSLAEFQQAILSRLPAERQPSGPRILNDEKVEPDRIALQDDIAHIASVLQDPTDGQTLDYVAQFLGGVARSAQDHGLETAARTLAQRRASGDPTGPAARALSNLLEQRLLEKMAI
jgi:DNA-binding NarL/FixJ family response regulator